MRSIERRGARKETILRVTRDLQTGIQTTIDGLNAEIDAGRPA